MKTNKTETAFYSTIGVLIMAVILIAANVIFGVVKLRIDLTDEKLFTLSEGTRTILNELDTPVTLRYYASKGDASMPVFFKTYAARVEDVLKEIQGASKGKVTLQKFDPKPDSDAEDSAKLDGLEGQTLAANMTQRIYLGLAASCIDQKVSIPFLSPERETLLEYDIMRAVTQVTQVDKPVVGVISTLPVFGQPANPMQMQMGQQPQGQDPWVFLSELQRDFEVREIQATTESIDNDISLLVVIHPKDASDALQYAIDQFVLKGGKVLAFLDPLAIMDNSGNPQNPLQRTMSNGSSLPKLLSTWGQEFDLNQVAADLKHESMIRQQGREQRMPALLSLTKTGMNTNDVVTSQIDNMLLPFSGTFSGDAPEGLERTVLLKTSTESQMVEKLTAQFSGEQIVNDFNSGGKEMALAVRLAGPFKTAFPEGKPGSETAADDGSEGASSSGGGGLKESEKDGVVVLVGDADMLFDQFAVQIQQIFNQRIVIPRNGNINFVQSMVEQMAGDSNLIAVRSRAAVNRPLTVVKDLQAQAEENYRGKIKEMQTKLQETQSKLNDLQRQKAGSGQQRYIMSEEQQRELENFRKEEARVNQELKKVRRNLRKDIDSLENRLKWVNIAGMPVLVTLFGILLAW